MTTESGPPTQGPQLSPDHQWIWDGSRWLPVAKHEALFKAWSGVGAGLPVQEAAPAAPQIPTPPPATAAAYAPQPYAPQPYAPVYMAPAAATQGAVPLWKQVPVTGMNKYFYMGAGFIALVVVGIILSSLGTIPMPWQQTSDAPAQPSAAPTISGSTDPERAQSFANGIVAPRMQGVQESVTLVLQTCSAGMTSACEDALIQVDNRTSAAITVLDQAVVPDCLTDQQVIVRKDLVRLNAAAAAAVKGFRDNRPGDIQNGIGQLPAANGQAQADTSALVSAAKVCTEPNITLKP